MENQTRKSNVTLYTVADISKITKNNQGYIHQLRKAGLLRFMKLGQYKCREEELQRFLAWAEGKDLSDPFDVKPLEGQQDN